MTWRAFVAGCEHLGRARARRKLRMADSYAAVRQDKKDADRWIRTHELIAE